MIDHPASWEKLRAELPFISNFTETERARLAHAYTILEAEFGPALFSQDHPVWRWLWDSSPWSRRRFLWLVERLDKLTTHPDRDRLCAKLAHPQQAGEAMAVLSWWHDIRLAGFSVDFEPSLPHKHGSADLLITAPTECYVELSGLDTGTARQLERDTRSLLGELFFSSPVPIVFAARVEHGLDIHSQRALAEEVTTLLRELMDAPRIIERPGLVLGVARLSAQPELEVWATGHGISLGSITGVPLPALEDWRMRRKIKEKSVQLPLGKTNLLILYSQEVYLQYAEIPNVLSILETELHRYPNISAMILRSPYFPTSNKPLRLTHQGHRIVAFDNGFHWECTLLLHNPLASLPLSSDLRLWLEQLLTQQYNFTTASDL